MDFSEIFQEMLIMGQWTAYYILIKIKIPERNLNFDIPVIKRQRDF